MIDALTQLLPGPAQAATFAVAVFVLNATPGVDFLLTVSRTLQGGARAGVAAVAGINAGCVVHALMAAFGLAALLVLHPGAFRAIQWAGAAYLAWLGWGMLRQAARAQPPVAEISRERLPRSWWADFRTGLLTNVLNPKVALFFLAFFPQFIHPSAGPVAGQALVLGAVFVAIGVTFDSLYALTSGSIGAWLARRPQAMRRSHLVSGTVYLALGGAALLTGGPQQS